jgi:hypothetical protein
MMPPSGESQGNGARIGNYSAPKVIRLDGPVIGEGNCAPGSGATGDLNKCNGNGNTAGDACNSDGNNAQWGCSASGNATGYPYCSSVGNGA